MSKHIKAAMVRFVTSALFIVAALVDNVGVSLWWTLSLAVVFLAMGVRNLVQGLRRRSE